MVNRSATVPGPPPPWPDRSDGWGSASDAGPCRPGGQCHAPRDGRRRSRPRRGRSTPLSSVPDHLVVDLVYHPAVTPWLEAARSRGARTANGVGMLVHQAALQLAAWTGHDAAGGGHVAGRHGPSSRPGDSLRPVAVDVTVGRVALASEHLGDLRPCHRPQPVAADRRPFRRGPAGGLGPAGPHRGGDDLLGHQGKAVPGRRGPSLLPQAPSGLRGHRRRGHGGLGPVRLPPARAGEHHPLRGHTVRPAGRSVAHRVTGPGVGAVVLTRTAPAATVRVRHLGVGGRHRHLLRATTGGARVPRPGPYGAHVGHSHRAGHQTARPRNRHRHGRHPDGHAGRGRHARPLPAAAHGRCGRAGAGRPQPRAAPALPDRTPHQLHLAQRRQPGRHLQRDPGQRGHRRRRHLRPGSLPRGADQSGLRARAADRLHLLGGRGAARSGRCRNAAPGLRGVGLAGPAHRSAGQGQLRAPSLCRRSSPSWSSRCSRTWG